MILKNVTCGSRGHFHPPLYNWSAMYVLVPLFQYCFDLLWPISVSCGGLSLGIGSGASLLNCSFLHSYEIVEYLFFGLFVVVCLLVVCLLVFLDYL